AECHQRCCSKPPNPQKLAYLAHHSLLKKYVKQKYSSRKYDKDIDSTLLEVAKAPNSSSLQSMTQQQSN
ncbi:hypothetical protein TorRG33x02_064360, partial [Trema orientale]